MKTLFYILPILLAGAGFLQGQTYVDTLAPETAILSENCGKFYLKVTEKRNGGINDIPRQIESGVSKPPFLVPDVNRTYNFGKIELQQNYKEGRKNYDFNFEIEVIDKFKPARATILIYDDADNNAVIDSIFYYPEVIELQPTSVLFGNTIIGTSARLTPLLRNTSDFKFRITNISMKYGNYFRIDQGLPNIIDLEPDSVQNIPIIYTPENHVSCSDNEDIDTLFVSTNCLTYKFPIKGSAVTPKINADDFDFGMVTIGSDYFTTDITGDSLGIEITNFCTGLLELDSATGLNPGGPYYLDTSTNFIDGKEIIPGESFFLEGIRFAPVSPGEYIDTLVLHNNGFGPDSLIILRGIAVPEGLNFASLDFGNIRLLENVTDTVFIKNNLDSEISITDYNLLDNNGDFSIAYSLLKDNPKTGSVKVGGSNNDSVAVIIQFRPSIEFGSECRLEVSYFHAGKAHKIYNYIRGYGFLPAIESDDYEFRPSVLVNTFHPDTAEISIRSTGQSGGLLIKEIISPDQLLPEFRIMELPPDSLFIPPGEEHIIKVAFRPEKAGLRSHEIKIISDAISGRDFPEKWDTLSVTIAGLAHNKIISGVSHNFGKILHCNSDTALVVFNNLSDSNRVDIIDFRIDNGDTGAFFLPDNYTLPEYFEPGGLIEIPVVFAPGQLDKESFEATARIFSDLDTAALIIRGKSFRYDVNLKMDTIREAMPGMYTLRELPKYPFNDFPVRINSGFFANLEIDTFSVELIFFKKGLNFTDMLRPGELTDGWNLDYSLESLDDTRWRLTVSGSGESPIKSSGILFKPVFEILLGDTSELHVEYGEIHFPGADNCINVNTSPGQIFMNHCGEELRDIIISQFNYELAISGSNPVTSEYAFINYSVGLEAHTFIGVYSSEGELIETISDDTKQPGIYLYPLSTEMLQSGAYFVKMNSGPYSSLLKLLITK
jgi:hypothetical protein